MTVRHVRCTICECPIAADERAVDVGADRWAHRECSNEFSSWIDARAPRSPAPLVDPTDDETIIFRRSA